MVADINGKQCSHVPDYLLSTVDGSFVVVDVKPSRRLDDPAVTFTFDWAREIAADCSWGFEGCSRNPIRYCWATCGSSPATGVAPLFARIW
jgi:hypothetical protein